MELVQVNWDDNRKLFLEFQKEANEFDFINPKTVKKVNVKYNLIKENSSNSYQKLPSLFNSVKRVLFNNSQMALSLELDEVSDFNDLKIKFASIVIFYLTGQRQVIKLNKEYNFSEILERDIYYEKYAENQCYEEETTSYTEKTLIEKKFTTVKRRANKLTTRKVITNVNSPINTNITPDEEFCNISISASEYEEWLKLKGNRTWTNMLFIARTACERLASIEKELIDANTVIREIALKNATALANPVQFALPPSQLNPPPNSLPQQYRPPRALASQSLRNPSAEKILRPARIPENYIREQANVIREMKEKFQKMKSLDDILHKVPEEELKKDIPRTDHLAYIEFKERTIKKALPN